MTVPLPGYTLQQAQRDIAELRGLIAHQNAYGLYTAQSDGTAYTVTGTGSFSQFSNAWSIPPGDPVPGAVYRLRVSGTGTQGSTAQNLSLTLAIGGSDAGGSFNSSSFAAAGAAFSFWLDLEVMCVTTGSSGTFQATKFSVVGLNSTIVNDSGAAPLSVNTTVPVTFMALAEWGSTTGAPTVTSRRSVFQRIV